MQLDPKDETIVANLTYSFEEQSDKEGKTINLLSTNVPKIYEGRGIAKLLANAAFEYCANHELQMKLTCWYLEGYLKRNPNPKYDRLVCPKA